VLSVVANLATFTVVHQYSEADITQTAEKLTVDDQQSCMGLIRLLFPMFLFFATDVSFYTFISSWDL